MCCHGLGMVLHELAGKDVEIPKHFSTSPSANERDNVSINTTKQKYHCTTGPHQMCRNITRLETEFFACKLDAVMMQEECDRGLFGIEGQDI
eukprot:2382458-Ditylum_brightwellii.AAC.1